jgi:lysophospholipid acyltransferase (LPLAT)-like uncharacterized protein
MAAHSIRQRLLLWLASHLGWLVVLLWGRLTRTEVIGRHHLDSLLIQGRPFLLCIWHGRIFLPMYLHRATGMHAMVSLHSDGEMIARTLQRLGYRIIRGSSTRGGRKALYQMAQALRDGNNGAIMPDGPRGPRHHFKPGAMRIAQRSGASLLPLTFGASRPIRFSSWDGFTIWRPLSKTVAIYGHPIDIPPDLDKERFEALRRLIEERMIEMERQADAYF